MICQECGMPCKADEFHPYAACLMFRYTRNSSVVRANLEPLRAADPDARRYRAFFEAGLPITYRGQDYRSKQELDAAIDADLAAQEGKT